MDFEYIATLDRTFHHLVCAVTDFNDTILRWNFHSETGLDSFKSYLNSIDLESTLFIGWAIGGAEIPCLCQIMGVDWVKKTEWIDDSVEFKMWALTHPDFLIYAKKEGSLASAIECFNLEDEYDADKDDTRDLILYDKENRQTKNKLRIENGTFSYTDEEMEKILYYCEQDVKILSKISQKIGALSKLYNIEITFKQRRARGRFCMLSGISYFASKGFPMDVEKVRAIFAQRDKIKKLIQLECNQKSKFQLYEPEYKGPRHNKTLVKYTFSHANFEKYIQFHRLDGIWEKTEKAQRLRLDEEYLDAMLSNYKDILEPIYHARNTLKQLSSTNLATLMSPEGYIKCPPFPFNQKTSRSSPKPKLGFILNLAPWLRMLIRPRPGRAFVSIDFKSQEILVAAVLAKDPQLLDSYLNDIYLSTAIKTGFAPEGATKKTHSHIRTPFKPISLGTLYGQREKSTAYKFMALNKEWDYAQAYQEAVKYFSSHMEVFYKYWEYVDRNYKESMERGYFQVDAKSGWIYFMRPDTKTTQVQNLPCQSYGAEMMRYSHNPCIEENIFVTPHHDAFDFECAIEDAVQLAKRVSQIMCEQSARVLGYPIEKDWMSTTTKIYTHEKPYFDSRGVETYKFVMNELGFKIDNNFQDVTEFENIHKISEITL